MSIQPGARSYGVTEGLRKLFSYRISLAFAVSMAAILMIELLVLAPLRPKAIRHREREIKALQERLISAQITSRGLEEVRKLIEKNLAWSSSDSLAQGASLTFLFDLHKVLDNLGVAVIGVEPRGPQPKGRFVETPYVLEVQCTYPQLCDLIDKMEKSPRLISLSSLEIENGLEGFFGERDADLAVGAFRVKLTLSTLTLVREG